MKLAGIDDGLRKDWGIKEWGNRKAHDASPALLLRNSDAVCWDGEDQGRNSIRRGGVDFAKFEGVLPLAHTELSGECGAHTRVLSLRWTCGCYQFVDGTWSQRLDEKNQRRDQVVTEEGPALCPKQVEMGGGRVRPSTWPSGELKVCSAVAIWGPYYPFPQCLSTDKGRNFHVYFYFSL